MKLHSFSDLQTLLPDQGKLRKAELSPDLEHDGKRMKIRIFLDAKGRKGKTMTIVSGLQHNPATMEEIARILKQHCGAGGNVKNGNIEIQGDQRERAAQKLHAMNYHLM